MDFFETHLIGSIGETVSENFLKRHNDVHRFGYEHSLQNITKDKTYEYDDVSNMIRAMPDFVIHNKQKKKMTFLEVKTTQNNVKLPERVRSCTRAERMYYSIRDIIRFYPGIVFMDVQWSNPAKIHFFNAVLSNNSKSPKIIFKELNLEELPFEFGTQDCTDMVNLINKYQFIGSEQLTQLLHLERDSKKSFPKF